MDTINHKCDQIEKRLFEKLQTMMPENIPMGAWLENGAMVRIEYLANKFDPDFLSNKKKVRIGKIHLTITDIVKSKPYMVIAFPSSMSQTTMRKTITLALQVIGKQWATPELKAGEEEGSADALQKPFKNIRDDGKSSPGVKPKTFIKRKNAWIRKQTRLLIKTVSPRAACAQVRALLMTKGYLGKPITHSVKTIAKLSGITLPSLSQYGKVSSLPQGRM